MYGEVAAHTQGGNDHQWGESDGCWQHKRMNKDWSRRQLTWGSAILTETDGIRDLSGPQTGAILGLAGWYAPSAACDTGTWHEDTLCRLGGSSALRPVGVPGRESA